MIAMGQCPGDHAPLKRSAMRKLTGEVDSRLYRSRHPRLIFISLVFDRRELFVMPVTFISIHTVLCVAKIQNRGIIHGHPQQWA